MAKSDVLKFFWPFLFSNLELFYFKKYLRSLFHVLSACRNTFCEEKNSQSSQPNRQFSSDDGHFRSNQSKFIFSSYHLAHYSKIPLSKPNPSFILELGGRSNAPHWIAWIRARTVMVNFGYRPSFSFFCVGHIVPTPVTENPSSGYD